MMLRISMGTGAVNNTIEEKNYHNKPFNLPENIGVCEYCHKVPGKNRDNIVLQDTGAVN